ncbi:MAG: M24 family metallopeptidase [Alphaproteobacteria bacterium]
MAPFERGEFLQRIGRAKARMADAGIDALLIINPSNMYYLTGYAGSSAYVPQMAVLRADQEEPSIILRRQDVPCALHTVFMEREHILGYPEDYIGSPDKDGFDAVIDRLREWGHEKRSIGVEKGSAHFSASAWEKFRNRLPNARFVDSTGLVTWLRIVKSPREISYMKQAARIADLAMRAGIDAIAPGARECDVAARIMAAQCAGTAEFGGDLPAPPAMPTGAKTSAPHLSWSEEPYKPGTPTNIELAGFRYRYAGALSRTIHLGAPPRKLRDLHAATLAGMETAFDAVRPDVRCEDVEAAFRAETTKHGFVKDSRIGYSIGIDWLEGSASLRPGDRTVLEPNMTFHMMLGMWQDGWGYVLSETFRVTERGSESFATLPRELFVK